MKTTIFARILLAIFLPLTLVFILVIYTISNIIYVNAATSAQEAARWEADQIARQFANKLDEMHGVLDVVSQSLADLDTPKPDARDKAKILLRRLIESNASFWNVWFAFEPGVFEGEDRVFQSLLRDDQGIREIHDMTPDSLADPARSPFYNMPLATGRLYMEFTERYDYGLGDGPRVATTMSVPILHADKAVGAVGIDIPYGAMVANHDLHLGKSWLLMLISTEGDVVYSGNADLQGGKFDLNAFSDGAGMLQAIKTKTEYLAEGTAPPLGEHSLVCLYPITWHESDDGIYLYLSVPTSDIDAMARSSVEIIVSTSILGFLLLGFSVYVATRNIVRPIKQLTVDFDKISRGDLHIASGGENREQERTSNVVELDILQKALWNMLGQISQTHELRLQAAEEQMEKEKVLAASQAKSQFLANMSHEIRTPMNAILGISEILLHSGQLSEQERKYVHDIKVSSDALLAIINDILDISRLESGKLPLTEKDYDFTALLENLRAMGDYLAAPNELRFEFNTSGNLPDCLRGDEIRLRQVLLNLLSNACKFTARGTVRFSVFDEGDTLRFVVEDSGQGISSKDQETLFEPFRRVESAENRAIQGSGLGLSITKNLVEMMGGTISLTSEPGVGSVFTVVIPRIPGDPTAIADRQQGGLTDFHKGLKVLVVDDNEINLSVAEGLLNDLYGIDCDLALSGPEALEKVAQTDYALIFMDQMMPEMDGVETAGHIRRMGGRFESLPIIALTANAIKGAKEELLAAGIDDYLTKPIEINEMDAMLRRWLPEAARKDQG